MDQAIFNFMHQAWGKSDLLDCVFKVLGVYFIYLIPIFLVFIWFLGNKKTALRATFSGLFVWQVVCCLIGTLYFRARPFTELSGKELLFHRPTYSFPSDHAAFLAALALSFWLAGEKTVSYWLFAISIIIPVTRVIAGFHYPADILAGWALGLIFAYLFWLIRKPIDKYISEPIIRVAQKLRLA